MRRIGALVFATAVLVAALALSHGKAFAAPLNCTVTTNGFSFADYDVFDPVDGTTILGQAVQYTCNKNSTAVSIALGPSSGSQDYAPREMLQLGEDPLYYYVSLGGFTPSCGGGSGQIWGDSALLNDTVSYVAVTGRRDVPNDVQAYGCIPHGQNVEAGIHSDSLLVTISF